ncbi:MAG: hypothetical protein MJZ34_05070 [Paludibacteraceae bacterium]|nr:hypothetical protein [Paludibacteraceae bacterium]
MFLNLPKNTVVNVDAITSMTVDGSFTTKYDDDDNSFEVYCIEVRIFLNSDCVSFSIEDNRMNDELLKGFNESFFMWLGNKSVAGKTYRIVNFNEFWECFLA